MDNSNYKQSREIIDAKIISEEETAADDNNDYQNNKRHKNNFRGNSDRNRILLIFIIIGAVFLALPVGGGILGLGLGFFGAVFGLGVGILCGGAACLIGAIVCFVKAFMIIAAYPGAGLITMAAGCALIALAFVFFWLAKGYVALGSLLLAIVLFISGTMIGGFSELETLYDKGDFTISLPITKTMDVTKEFTDIKNLEIQAEAGTVELIE